MPSPVLYSIKEARRRLGGIAQDTIYRLLRSGKLASTVIGRRRYISDAALEEYVAANTTTTVRPASPTPSHARTSRPSGSP